MEDDTEKAVEEFAGDTVGLDTAQASGLSGWFRAYRNQEALELISANPNAFVLAYLIAYRAQWTNRFNRHDLQMGEALLGDFTAYGMTEREYRTAKGHLEKWGFATFKTTNKGTIGKLTDERLFGVRTVRGDGQKVGRSDTQATDDRQAIRTSNVKADTPLEAEQL